MSLPLLILPVKHGFINNTIVGCIITPPMDNKVIVAYYIGDAKEEELVD